MSNLNSIAGIAISGGLRNQFSAQTVASTTETILQVNTDSGTPVNYYLTLPSGGQVYGAQTGLDYNGNPAIIDRSSYITGLPNGESNDQFNSSSWDGHVFKVRVVGIGNAGANAAQNVTINLYQGTSATLGSDHILGTTGATFATVAGGPFNFYVEATLLWDATSQILSGSFTSEISFGSVSQFTAPTAIGVSGSAAPITSVTAANLSFLASIKLGNAASSTVALREFVIDRV